MTVLLLAVIAISATVTAAFVTLIYVKLGQSLTRVFLSAEAADEAAVIRQVTVTDALIRIEEAAVCALADIAKVGGRVNVATEWGYQNAASADRMEAADKVVADALQASEQVVAQVAEDLRQGHLLAQRVAEESLPGEAADAAAKGPPVTAEPQPEP